MKLVTSVERVGQKFVDEAVYVEVSRAKPLSLYINTGLLPSARHVFGEAEQQEPRIEAPLVQTSIDALSHYQRTRLRWMTPDGKGGLVPSNNRSKGNP